MVNWRTDILLIYKIWPTSHITRFSHIQSGPKVGIQYIVNYCIPTFGPPCMYIMTILAVTVIIYYKVAQKVMPHIFFSHSRIKIAIWKLRQNNTDIYCAHVSTWSSDRQCHCSSMWKWRLCLTHITTMSCKWILGGRERKCGKHSQMVVYCVWKLCSQ